MAFLTISGFISQHWAILIIPFVAGFVGWFTNWLALKMTFYPLEFWGLRPFLGWQGIIPSKAQAMSAKAVELITSKLINVRERFSQIDPEAVSEDMSPHVKRMSRRILEEVMSDHAPLLWNVMPQIQKEIIHQHVANDFPQLTRDIMEEIKESIEELFDAKKMAVDTLTQDKALLNRMFQDVGKKEFVFIEQSGAYFGFIFGIPQMILFYFFQDLWWAPWVFLPVGGILVGYLTNWLALKLIFEPTQEQVYFGVKFQGLFIKRQQEVAAEYAKLVADQIYTPKRIFDSIFSGPSADRLVRIIEHHVKEGIDKSAGMATALIVFTSGSDTYKQMKTQACKRVIEELPLKIHSAFEHAEHALDLENELRTKMQALPPEEFIGFLRPAFQEDEWKLILVGAILGGIAGWLQIYTV